jgi:Family of unknown function (DUF6152)
MLTPCPVWLPDFCLFQHSGLPENLPKQFGHATAACYISAPKPEGQPMKILAIPAFCAAVAAALLPPVLLAHHSFAVFDFQQQIPFEGVVESVKFRNPHIELVLKSKSADGSEKLVHFIEGAPANMLVRNGIRPEHVAPGQHLKTFGSPLIADPEKFFLRVIILDDGTEYRN